MDAKSSSPGPIGAPIRTSPVTITTKKKAEKKEEWSTHTGNSPSGARTLFRLDPTVPPFVSAREKAESPKPEKGGSQKKQKKASPPPDPGILAWVPAGILAEEEVGQSPPSPSDALGLSGSLFTAGGGIWDPSRPVNTEMSWTGALMSTADKPEDKKKLKQKAGSRHK